MKKRYLGILIILISFILTFGFSSSISADESDLIHGVVPTKVTAHLHHEWQDAAGWLCITDWYFEFWNVGELGGEQYSKAKITMVNSDTAGPPTEIWDKGYFTGGPNGIINAKTEGYDGVMKLELKNGKNIDCGGWGIAIIDNPGAFNGWVDKEISTVPTIELSILEGPVEDEDGKTYSFIVEVDVTGTPEPEISFNRDDSEGSLGPNNALIKLEAGQEFTVKATATNTLGSVSAETILSTKNIKPKPNLTIVIPGGYPGFGIKDTKIEVKNGVVDCVISYRGFDNVPIKGTYDPEKGLLNATITIDPQHDTANLWLGFEGNLTVDLSKEKTAGFMTISGNMWQWIEDDGKWEEGDDKGPAGEFVNRVYYTVEYPSGQPEESADSKSDSEPVDSNLKFWISSHASPSSEYINCFIKRAGSNELEKVNEKTRINVGDTIVNPPGAGEVTIYPKDDRDSGINLQPGTNFTISEPTQFLTFGEFLYKAEKNPKSGMDEHFNSFEMQLAKLKVKLKGTTVVIKEDGETSSVKVIEGVAECTEIETGKTVEVNAGEMLAATEAGIGEVQAFDINAENARWEKGLQAIAEITADTIQETTDSVSKIQNKIDTTQQKNQDNFFSNLQNYFNEAGISNLLILLIGVFLILVVLTGLIFLIVKTRKR